MEGGRERGREKGEFKQLWKGVRSRGPKFSKVAENLPLDKQAPPIETRSSDAGCLARNSGNEADSSKRLLPSDYLSETTPASPKKTFFHQPVSLAEVQTELYWRGPMLMILRIPIYKNMKKPCTERRLSSEQIPPSGCHKLK